MSQRPQPDPAENPFSAARIRPGAVAYLPTPTTNVGELVERLRQNDWWGQIVGPHGSGKSALLAALVPVIEQSGRPTLVVELHDGQRRLPIKPGCLKGPDAPKQLVVDGYEQLSRWHRHRAKRLCRRRGLGLLVTSHDSVGLPDLCRVATDLTLAQQIVSRFQDGFPPLVTAGDVAATYAAHDGDVREMLFDFYDLYEARRRETQDSSAGVMPPDD